MKTIWKYELDFEEKQTIELPLDAKIISLLNQGGRMVFYIEHKKEETRTKNVEFIIGGTGGDLPNNIDEFSFLNTVPVGEFVFHVYYARLN